MKVSGGSYSEVASSITSTSYTVTGLTLGTTYEFTVEARNSVGYSSVSSSLSLLHAVAPATPSAPTTTISGQNVVIDWSAPGTNGAAITSYTVTIRQSDGATFSEETTSCNGSDSTIISTTECTVPISTLSASPFSLGSGASVYAKVLATNSKGSSSASSEGNGATLP